MPTYRLPRFARPEFLRAVHPERLLDLLRPHAAFFAGRDLPLPSPGGRNALDLDALAKILTTPGPDTPAGLADALYFVHELSTPGGLYALLDALTPARLGFEFHWGLEPSDVAVRAWLADPGSVERVHAEQSAAQPRRFDLFQADADPLPAFAPPTPDELRPLERALDELLARKGRGRGTRVFACPDDRECLFLVRRPEPYRREPALDGVDASSVLFRPFAYDVVGYEPGTGTLRIHADRRPDLVVYRHEFGKHLFGSINFFPQRGRYTLEPLRAGESSCLGCADVPGIKEVALIEVELSRGGPYGGAVVLRAKNVFADLRRRDESLPAGTAPVRATFSVRFRGGRSARAVTVIPPNVAQYCRDDDGPLIDAWLRARGFIRPRREAGTHAEPHPAVPGR